MRRLLMAVLTALCAAVPAAARVDVTLDQETLNQLITNLAPDNVAVALPAGAKVHLRMENVKVTGFDPAGGGGSRGHVLTSLNLKIPELGLDVPVAPRLSLQFKEGNGRKVAYLKFEEVNIPLAATGNLNIAPLLPILPLVADTVWNVDAARGPVRVEPKLVDAVVGTKNLRLGFDLEVGPAAKGNP
jgi:hypothetical protein